MPLIQPSRRFLSAQHHLLPLLQAAACNLYDPSNAAVAAQRDASGEDGKADVTVDGAQAAKSSPVTAGSSGWKAGAARLFNLQTNGQSRVDVTTVNLSAQGNIPDGRFYYSYPNANNPNIPQSQWYTTKLTIALRGFVNASGSASAALDSREVFLTRGSAPKVKGDPGVTVDEKRDEWRELGSDGSWTTHGQSRWSYTERTSDNPVDPWGNPTGDYQDQATTVSQVFSAQPSGSWSNYSQLKGVWSNPDPHDLYPPGTTGQPASHSHVENLPDGGALKDDVGFDRGISIDLVKPTFRPQGWYNTPSTGQNPVTVTYKLTDNGGTSPITATATYQLQLHDEWENATPDNAYSYSDAGTGTPHPGQSLQRWQQTFAYPGGNLVTSDPEASWEVDSTQKLTATLKTTFSADFKLADWASIGGSAELIAEQSIDATFKATAPKPKDIFTVAPGDTFRPVVNYDVVTAHSLVDHFVVSGFDGNGGRSDRKWPQSGDIRVDKWFPTWLQIPSGSGTPSTGSTYPAPTPIPTPAPGR